MTEAELVTASKNGDENAFKEIVKRHQSRIAATVFGMLGHCPEAEDIGQETFIRFYQNLKNFRGDASIGTYLTRIAINLSLNELKRRKRKTLLFSQKHQDDRVDFADENSVTQFDDRKEITQHAVRKLESKFRSVVVLRLMDGYSTAETAEMLKLPIGTVLSRLARAQQKLKEILSPYLGELK